MPTSVATLADLDAVRNDLAGDYVQTADIDASPTGTDGSAYWNSGAGWEPIGTFTGTYDGGGYTISDLYIDRTTTLVSLFGRVNGGTVSNVLLVDCDITSTQNECGGIVGRLTGTVQGCSVSGSISGSSYVGGIAGRIASASSIVECRCTAAVSASSNYSGGICGYATAASGTVTYITDCFATGAVSASGYAGGLIGYQVSRTTITDCYAIGAPTASYYAGGLTGFTGATGNTTTASYWDKTTSGTETSGSGTGKTTAQMKALATFSSDWSIARVGDWVAETWIIGDSDGDMYPELSWAYEAPSGTVYEVEGDALAFAFTDGIGTSLSFLRGDGAAAGSAEAPEAAIMRTVTITGDCAGIDATSASAQLILPLLDYISCAEDLSALLNTAVSLLETGLSSDEVAVLLSHTISLSCQSQCEETLAPLLKCIADIADTGMCEDTIALLSEVFVSLYGQAGGTDSIEALLYLTATLSDQAIVIDEVSSLLNIIVALSDQCASAAEVDALLHTTIALVDAGATTDMILLLYNAISSLSDSADVSESISTLCQYVLDIAEQGMASESLTSNLIAQIVAFSEIVVGRGEMQSAHNTLIALNDEAISTTTLETILTAIVALSDSGLPHDTLAAALAVAVSLQDSGMSSEVLQSTISIVVQLSDAGLSEEELQAACNALVTLIDTVSYEEDLSICYQAIVALSDAGVGQDAILALLAALQKQGKWMGGISPFNIGWR
jgi:hypothetical protein